MKSKCSFILKASTALVLAMLVLFGSIATVVGAVAPADKSESDIAVVARKALDIAESVDISDYNRISDGAADDTAVEDTKENSIFDLMKKSFNITKTGAKVDLAETGWAGMAITDSVNNWGHDWFADGNSGYVVRNTGLKKGEKYYFRVSAYDNWGTFRDYGGHSNNAPISEGTAYGAKLDSSYALMYTVKDSGILKVTIDSSFNIYVDECRWQLNQGTSTANDSWYELPNHYNMTVSSTSGTTFTYEMDLTAGTKYYFDVRRDLPGSSHTYNYYKSASTLTLGTAKTLYKYDNLNADKCNFTPSTTGKYKLTWTASGDLPNTGTLTITRIAASKYYLTGWLNGAGYSGTSYQFSGSADNYTLTFSSTTAAQYLTITDDLGATYHPGSHPAASGAAYTSTDSNPTADNKWGITSGAKNRQITFTWKPTSKTLSWTIGAGEMITVYAKDGAAPINWDQKTQGGATPITGYNSNYYYNFAAIATTEVSCTGYSFTQTDCKISGASSSTSKYYTGSVEAGKTLTITTTITNSNSWRSKYYVKGWSINGVTYKVGTNVKGVNTGTSDGSSGTYTMNYTIPASTTSSTKIEITPIYYLVDNSNTITFYLEGFDSTLQTTGGWGHTPYAYPFYGSLSGYQNSFGAYPGQPMVYVDGKYSMEIPITSNAIYSHTYDGTIIKGITVNNGYADHVHRNLVYGWTTGTDTGDDNKHMQTYDFDDFYKIYNEKRDSQGNRPNAIILRIKNKTTYYNRDNYGDAKNGVNWKFNREDPYATISNTTVTNFANRNGWELLTDRYGRPVDLFGNVISTTYSADAEKAKPAIRVISTGYNENIAGDYGTGWLIYTPTGADGSAYSTAVTNGGFTGSSGYTLQTAASNRKAVPPSVFLLASDSSFNTTTYPSVSRTFDGASYTDTITNYKTLYNTLKTSGTAGKNAVGRYVYISYEKNAQRYGKNADASATRALYGASRADARWYYTYATDMVRSKIKIQYWDGSKYVDESSYVTGYNSIANQGSHTGCKAYFSNPAFDGAVDSGDVLINSGDFALKAVSATGWVFDSWEIEYDGGTYTELSRSATATTPMSASDTLVARFKPLTDGYLNLSHHLSTSSTGAGTTQIRVQVYTSSAKTSELYDSGTTTEDVTLDTEFVGNNVTSNYIWVTLTTTASGDDVFNSIDAPSTLNTPALKQKFFGGVTTKTTSPYSFGFSVSDLWNSGGTAQTYKSLPYTSQITKTDHTYKITYKYPKRGSANSATDGQYTVSGTFTSAEYAAYVTGSGLSRTVSAEFIKSKAPFESNFKKTLTMNYSGATQSYDTINHAHTITVTAGQSDFAGYYAIFDLPYQYYTATGSASGVAYKKYTAKPQESGTNKGKILQTDDAPTIEIDTAYNTYFTSTSTQTKVSKVTDAGDVNHTGNDFLTAPDEIYSSDGSTKMYFQYWSVMTVDQSRELLKVYYPDFNYRSFGNYYVTPVYSTNANDSWHMNYSDSDNATTASIMYLDCTRNQWNSSTSQSNNTSSTIAADMIYNDFLLSYTYKGQEIKSSSEVTDVGMIIELVPTTKGGSTYALGDASSADTSVYKTTYESTRPNTSTLQGIANNGSSGNYIRINGLKNSLNNRNRVEYGYSFYSRYGQNGFEFKTDSTVDNYVFRAYAYFKTASGVTISEPVYFSMRYTANRKG